MGHCERVTAPREATYFAVVVIAGEAMLFFISAPSDSQVTSEGVVVEGEIAALETLEESFDKERERVAI